MVRNNLGWSRKVLGRVIGISPIEVFYIECGEIPADIVIIRLKLLHKYSILLNPISKIIFWVIKIISIPFVRLSLKLHGRMIKGGQLVLSCSSYSPILRSLESFLKGLMNLCKWFVCLFVLFISFLLPAAIF